jgi:hypothetical protein
MPPLPQLTNRRLASLRAALGFLLLDPRAQPAAARLVT